MREHLYQGKRLDNGEWVEGGNLIHRTRYYGDPVDDYFIMEVGDFDYDYYDAYEVRPDTLREYTGLRDKNGKRIFEGDILLFECGYKFYYEVFFEMVHFAIGKIKKQKTRGLLRTFFRRQIVLSSGTSGITPNSWRAMYEKQRMARKFER